METLEVGTTTQVMRLLELEKAQNLVETREQPKSRLKMLKSREKRTRRGREKNRSSRRSDRKRRRSEKSYARKSRKRNRKQVEGAEGLQEQLVLAVMVQVEALMRVTVMIKIWRQL